MKLAHTTSNSGTGSNNANDLAVKMSNHRLLQTLEIMSSYQNSKTLNSLMLTGTNQVNLQSLLMAEHSISHFLHYFALRG